MQHKILLAALGHPGSLVGPPPPSPPDETGYDDEGREGDYGCSATVSITSPTEAEAGNHVPHPASSSRPIRFRCTPLVHHLLPPSQCECIDRIVSHGHHVRFLRWFVDRVASRSFMSGEMELEIERREGHNDRRRRRGRPRPRRRGRDDDGLRSDTESESESGLDSDGPGFTAFPSTRSAYVEAAAGAISNLLTHHERAICKLERDIRSASCDPGPLGLGHLGMEIEFASGWIPHVANFVRSLLGIGEEDHDVARNLGSSSCVAMRRWTDDSESSSAGAALLSILDECMELTPPPPATWPPDIHDDHNDNDVGSVVISPREALSGIRSAVCGVYTRQIAAWVVVGRLLDPHDEFFVVPRGGGRRGGAGETRGLEFGNIGGGFRDRLLDLNHHHRRHHGAAYQGGAVEGEEDDTVAEVNREYVLRYSRLPPTVSPTLGRKILFLGRAVRILRDDGDDDGSHDSSSSIDIDVASLAYAEWDFFAKAAAVADLERTIEMHYSEMSVRLHRALLGCGRRTDNDGGNGNVKDDGNLLLLRQLNVLHNVYLSGDGSLISSFLNRCDDLGLWTRRLPDFHHGALLPVLTGTIDPTLDDDVPARDLHPPPSLDLCRRRATDGLGSYKSEISRGLRAVVTPRRFEYDGGRSSDEALFRPDYDLRTSGSARVVTGLGDDSGDGGGCIVFSSSGHHDDVPRRRWWDGNDDSSSHRPRDGQGRWRTWRGPAIDGNDHSSSGGGGDPPLDCGDGGVAHRPVFVAKGGESGASRYRPGCVYTMRKRTLGRGFETSVTFRFLPSPYPLQPSSTNPPAPRRSSGGKNGTTPSKFSGGGALCVVLAKDRPYSAVLSVLDAVSSGHSRSESDEPTPLPEDGAGDDRAEGSAVVVVVRRLLVGGPEEDGGGTRMELTIDGEEDRGRAIVDVVDPYATLALTVGWNRGRHGGITADLRVEGKSSTTTTRMDASSRGTPGSGYALASVQSRPGLLRHRLCTAGHPRLRTRSRRHHPHNHFDEDETDDHDPLEAHVAVGASGAGCIVHRWSLEPGLERDDAARGAALEMAAEAAAAFMESGASSEELDNVGVDPRTADEGMERMMMTTQPPSLLRRVHDEVMAKLYCIDDGGAGASATGGGGMQLAFEYEVPRRPLLSLVLSDDALRDYRRFFDRIFPAQLCLHELRECWRVMMIGGGGRGGGVEHHGSHHSSPTDPTGRRCSWELRPLWALRARMEFVVGNLLRYYQVDVALSALQEQSASIKASENVDHVLAAHARYMATLRRRFFLVGRDDYDGVAGGASTLATVLGRMTAQVLRFSGLVRRVGGGVDVTSSSYSSGPMMIAAKNNILLLRDETGRISNYFDDELSNLLVLLRRHGVTELCHRLDFSGWLSSRMAAK